MVISIYSRPKKKGFIKALKTCFSCLPIEAIGTNLQLPKLKHTPTLNQYLLFLNNISSIYNPTKILHFRLVPITRPNVDNKLVLTNKILIGI